MVLLPVFVTLLHVSLSRRQTAIRLTLLHWVLQQVVLIDVYEENLASHRYVIGKGPHSTPKMVLRVLLQSLQTTL